MGTVFPSNALTLLNVPPGLVCFNTCPVVVSNNLFPLRIWIDFLVRSESVIPSYLQEPSDPPLISVVSTYSPSNRGCGRRRQDVKSDAIVPTYYPQPSRSVLISESRRCTYSAPSCSHHRCRSPPAAPRFNRWDQRLRPERAASRERRCPTNRQPPRRSMSVARCSRIERQLNRATCSCNSLATISRSNGQAYRSSTPGCCGRR